MSKFPMIFQFCLIFPSFFFFYGLCDPLACSLLGYQSQNSSYTVNILWPFLLRIMCYVLPSTDGSGPPSLPPPRFPLPSSMSPNNFPARASLSPPLASSPSVCCLFSVPPDSAGFHPPSTRMTDWRPVPCRPRFPVQRPNVEGLPTRPVRLVVLGSGVGGGA